MHNSIKWLLLIVMSTFIVAETVSAATFNVSSSSCTGAGSIVEAMTLANANVGADTIALTPGLAIDASSCPPVASLDIADFFALQAKESVVIEGNGARIVGNIVWLTSGGLNTPLDVCPQGSDIVVALTPGFILVGEYGMDNSAVVVTIRNLTLRELNSVARIEKNASLVIENSNLERIISAAKDCQENAIRALEGANFRATRTTWNTVVNFGNVQLGYASNPAIAGGTGTGAGDLIIEESRFDSVFQAGAIGWNGQAGSQVNIVSSVFNDSNGIVALGESQTNIVNTVLSFGTLGDPKDEDRIANVSTQEMNIVASTILYPDVNCDSFCEFSGGFGWIYRGGAGSINFIQSAIGVNFPSSQGTGKMLDPNPSDPSTGFSADQYTWIQPTTQQGASTLKSVTNQPNLLTESPGLPTMSFFGLESWATPLQGTVTNPGQLIDIIDNAQCDQANRLSSPVDGSCITVDAFGNPRVDGNDKRNIGAVQIALAPSLSVNTIGDARIDISWTRPQDPSASAITGYEVRHRIAGISVWTTTDIAGPDSLNTNVPGLLNGTLYEFQVDSLVGTTPGTQASNVVSATPVGLIGTPVLNAISGDSSVTLTWVPPSDGGHTLESYSVLFRPLGASAFSGAKIVNAPATQTSVSGLNNGTPYEFLVSANATDGEYGPQGVVTAVPLPVPIIQYPTPVTIYENSLVNIFPKLDSLSSSPLFVLLAGSLPPGLTLNNTTGEISGNLGTVVPSSYTATILLSQAGVANYLNVQTDITINVLNGIADLHLNYPDIDVSANSQALNVMPTVTGTQGGTLSFSLVPGDVLPAGLILNAASGEITGIVSTATDGFRGLTVEVQEGGSRIANSPLIVRIQPTLSYQSVTGKIGDPLTVVPTTSASAVAGSFALTAGSIPNGLALDPVSGVISGTPLLNGFEAVTITWTLTGGQTQSVSTTVGIDISSYQSSLQYPLTELATGVPVIIQPLVKDTKGATTYTLFGQLPAGLSLDPSTGIISGTPSGDGFPVSLVVQVDDLYLKASGTLELVRAGKIIAVPVQPSYPLLAFLLAVLACGAIRQRVQKMVPSS